jgi:chromosome segregation ATPase
MKKNQKYREKAKELEKENAGLKLQVRIIPDLQNKINELTAVNDQLKLQLEQFEATKVQVSHLQSQIDGLILNRDNLLLSVQEKEGELSRLRPIVSEYELLKIRAEAYEQEIQKLKILVAADMIRMQEFETMIANLQFSVKNEKELAEQNDKLLKENLAFRQKVQELEYSYGTLSTKYHKMESIYAQIKGVAENIGEVHEKLIETCEETEKIDSNLKNIETSENKTVIQQLEYTETPQRF